MTDRNMTSTRLHDALLEALVDRVENGETVLPKGGDEPVTVDAPAATLSAAINFLKTFPPGDDDAKGPLGDKLKQYADDMPFKD